MTVPVRSVPSTLNWTLAIVRPVAAVAVAVTVTLPETVALAAGAVTVTTGAGLLTVIGTALEVTLAPEESIITAVKACVPLIHLVASRVTVYGLASTGEPILVPSILNWTLEIVRPALAVAVAVNATLLPETLAPEAGAVMETAGGVTNDGVGE